MEAPTVDRSTLLRMGGGIVLLVAGAAALAFLLEEPLSALARDCFDRLGMPGIFLGVLVADTSPLPLTHEPVLVLGVTAGVNPWQLWAVAGSASVLAGLVGYTAGAVLVSRSRLQAWLASRYPGFISFMEKHGVRGVAVAAILPIPFALATWSAGMVRLGFFRVALVSLLRIPKTGFYLGLIVTGWELGGG